MATPVKDRLNALLASATFNGIDFVEIASKDQTKLKLHFLNTVALKGTLAPHNPVTITGGETIATVPLLPINEATDWTTDADNRPILNLAVAASGDFSNYIMTVQSSALDSYFAETSFSFKALCPSDLDCEPPATPCPTPSGEAPPIEYLAKDFLSFRKALSDFSALRYPDWLERSEADFGMMFIEALSALADDLSYAQDRVATESSLDTVTQRRSLVRHARLVDYQPRPAMAAQTTLQFTVSAATNIPNGFLVSARNPDGQEIYFEVGTGLVNHTTGDLDVTAYPADPRWNSGIVPYYWDDSQRCLMHGATEMWVVGHGLGLDAGQALLIDTRAQSSADPNIREVVHLIQKPDEVIDPLFPGPPNPPTQLTHLTWSADEALQHDHDLTLDANNDPYTVVGGNLVPATQGHRYANETFAIGTPPVNAPATPLAIARLGPNSTAVNSIWQYLYTLANAPMAWLAPSDPNADPLPEIYLQQGAQPWLWRQWLLDAERFENSYTVDPVLMSPIHKNADGSMSYDYDGDNGDTIRFGDGIFGGMPDPGMVFQATYRVGGGAVGNVAADSITKIKTAPSQATAVTNPFAATGGADAETFQTVQRLAPQAFRAVQYRAVRREDYETAAETLPWVERAGTVFRWTGSWLTIFTTPDPKGSEALMFLEHNQLINLLNRYRMAGYESYVPDPQYVSLDLFITVCAQADAFRGDVEAAILRALSTATFGDGTSGFFYYDNFTFGTPLECSRLEAAIQGAYGVDGAVSIQYRQRGVQPLPIDMGDEVAVGANQILRVDNDPNKPERGSLSVTVEGGK